MPKTFHKVRRNGTFALLCLSVFIILVLSITQPDLYDQLKQRIKEDIWPAIIALATFFGFVVGGVLKNPPKSFSKFLQNGFLQIAVLELFLFSAGITYVAYSNSRPGQIELKLQSGQTLPKMKVLVKTEGDSASGKVSLAPDILPDLKRGTYKFTIVEPGYETDSQTRKLGPGEVQVVTLVDRRLTGAIIVRSTPPGAEIWINGLFTSKKTPDTLQGLGEGTVVLQLRIPGFDVYESTIKLITRSTVNLGTIHLRRLFSVTFFCVDKGTRWSLRGQDHTGSETILFPEGHYIVTFVVPGRSKDQKSISIDGDTTIIIP